MTKREIFYMGAIFYLFHLFNIIMHIYYYENNKFLMLPLIISVLLTIYEIFKMYVSKVSEYFAIA